MTDHEALEALSKKATQGKWTGIGFGYEKYAAINSDGHEVFSTARKANAEFIVALVNAYRTGQLIPAPSVDDAMVERVARAIDGADKQEGAIASVMHFDWVRDMRIAQAIAAISAMQVKP